MRTGYECLFHACALWRDPSLIARIQAQGAYDLYQVAKRVRETYDLAELEPQVRTLLDQHTEKPPGVGMSAKDAAKLAGMEKMYAGPWALLTTLGTHATARSLHDYAPQEINGKLYSNVGPRFNDAEHIFNAAVLCIEQGQERFRRRFNHLPFAQPSPKRSPESPGHPSS